MPHVPDQPDLALWHRYFAIECNNRAWDLSVRMRGPAEDEDMLNAAHAAAFHWRIAGNELNHMRAKMLLAEVHASVGLGKSALAYANDVCRYFLSRETPDWEIAFTHVVQAHAAYAAGDGALHRSAYAESVRAIAAVEDEEERAIVEKSFAQVPRPD
jgi:hypothetical protein